MIKKIHAENFLCFRNITLDLSGPKGRPLNYVLIYGENGSGKTNLLRSLRLLRCTLDSRLSKWVADYSIDGSGHDVTSFNMKNIYPEYSMIGSKDPIHLEYTFEIGGRDATYVMTISNEGLTKEVLVYVLNKRKSTLFSIDENSIEIGKCFSDEFRKSMMTEVQKYWGPHSLLSILNKESNDLNRMFAKNNIADELVSVIEYIKDLDLFFSDSNPVSKNPLMNPGKGQMPSAFEPVMDAVADAMNDFFCGLYSDVECVRYLKRSNIREIDYELVFDKRVEGRSVSIPYSKESSGTRKLVDEFYHIMACVYGGVGVVDEMDTGIHDVLMKELFENIKGSVKGQLLATTHNTMLLQNLDPRCIFILDIDGEGCRDVKSISAIARTQKCNNNTKRYIEGDLGGIPVVGYLDLRDIADRLFEKLEMKHYGQ